MNTINLQTKTSLLPQLMGRIKLSNFLALREDKFKKLVNEIEDMDLFKKFAYPDTKQLKVISYKKYPNTEYGKRFYEFKDEISFDTKTPDISGLIEGNPKIIEKIKSIGMENFKKYFLYCQTELGLKEIATACKITINEAKMIQNVVDSVEIANELHQAPHKNNLPVKSPYTKIAKIVIGSSPEKSPSIEFYSLNDSRGRYLINYKKIAELKTNNNLSKNELKKLDRLLRKLELINARKTILYNAITQIANKQTKYFKTNDIKDLKSYTQKMIAGELMVNPGALSRVINYKTLETPQGEEKPIRFFLPNGKQVRKQLIREIVLRNGDISDRLIREEIKEKLGILLARRTVCQYKNELLMNIKKTNV